MALSRKKMTSTLCVVLLWAVACVVGETNNVLNPDNTISWGDLAPGGEYQTDGYTADDGGLDAYYALAKSFIDSSLPEELPVDKTRQLLDGDVEMIDGAKEIAIDFIGFMICLVIGFLFILIFPIVGLCFCCCRCCGNCGGKKHFKADEKAKCKRYVFSAIVFVLSLFVVTGAACTFVTSEQLSKSLDGLNDSFSKSVNDTQTFVENIHDEFRQLGDTNFLFLSGVLENYVGNATDEVSEALITKLNEAADLDQPLADIKQESETAQSEITQMEEKIDEAEAERDAAVTAFTTFNPTCASCNAEKTQLNNLDFDALKTQLTDFKTKVTTDVFDKMKSDLDNEIRTEVQSATSSIDVSQQLQDIYDDQIKPMLDQVDKLKSNTQSDLETYRNRVEDFTDTVKPYDQYRWYAGLALACFLLLIALLMLIGVLLGLLCGRAAQAPTKRGCASNCGGIMLMAAVGLIFIFGALLMLLTTLMYIFGSLTERYVCQSVDDLSKIEKYTSTFDSLGMDLRNISFDLNGNTVTIGLSKIMDGCEGGATLYTVLGLQSIVNDSLSEIENYKNDLDITSKMGSVGSAAASGSLDVTSEIDALQETTTSIDDLKTLITDMKTSVTSMASSIDTKSGSTQGTDNLNPLIQTLTEMEAIADSLKTTAQQISTTAGTLGTKVSDVQANLSNQTYMNALVTDVTSVYVNTMFAFVDSYVNDVKSKLAASVAICTPIYSIFTAIFDEAFCHGIIDPLNGFWLAIGWCIFFFMPSLVFAVKLAKHFRRMTTEDSYTDPTIESSQPPYVTQASFGKGNFPLGTPSIFPPPNGNKVAPF